MSKVSKFFKDQDCHNNEDYDIRVIKDFLFTENDMLKFAERYAKHYHKSQLQKIMPSDEEIENHIESYIENHGYKLHDLSMDNDVLTDSQVFNICDWLRSKINAPNVLPSTNN